MLKLWGRTNSVNVKKVLWMLDEIGQPYDRVDAGMEHGRVNDADYRAMNPNGRVPTLEDGDFILWESNSVLRYLGMKYQSPLYPAHPAARASADRWMDWQLSTLSPAERNLFWGLVRTPPEKRDMAAVEAAAGAEVVAEETFADGGEFEFDEEGAEGGFVEGADDEIVEGDVERAVGPDGGETAAEAGLVGEGDEVFLLFTFELVGVGEEVFEGAPLADEGFGGFFADAWDAGEVVGGVAPEGEDIDDL
jgi:glutathione S-transferase